MDTLFIVIIVVSLVALAFFMAWLLERQKTSHLKAENAKLQEQMQFERSNLTETFRSIAGDALRERSDQLKSDNSESMQTVLLPLNEQMKQLGSLIDNLSKTGVSSSSRLETLMREMTAQTQKIGNDAVNLTNALKANPKKQGDWGELILDRLLEANGLQKDVHFYAQQFFSKGDGSNRGDKPDVIVRFPGDRGVVIDSKVSLTAYVNYIEAETKEEREQYLKQHVTSVRNHVDELAEKSYENLHRPGFIKQLADLVLMFVPNEASYIAALQADRNLYQEALNKNVLIVGPSNMSMALSMAHLLWRNEAQVKNVKEIFNRAATLCAKFVGFSQDITLIGKNLQKLTKSYNDAVSKGYNGQGSLLRQCQMLEELGVNYKRDEKQDEVELIDDSFINLPNDMIVSSAGSEISNEEPSQENS